MKKKQKKKKKNGVVEKMITERLMNWWGGGVSLSPFILILHVNKNDKKKMRNKSQI